MRPTNYVGGQPQTAIDWSTVPGKSQLRFTTGKGTISWTNQAGSACSGIYNYNSIVLLTVTSIIAANITQQFGSGFGVCAPPNSGCYSPLCPISVGGFPPYQLSSFQPPNSGGGNTCASGIGAIVCN